MDVSSVKSGQLDVLEALAGSLAVKAVEGNILAVICINRLTEIGQVLALEAHAAVAQRDAVRTAHQEAGRSDFLDALIVTRTQVIQTALPLALAAQRDLHAVEQDVLDVVALAAGQEYAVFAVAGDVREADVRDLAGRHAFVALVGGQNDRLRRAPPAVREAAGLDDDVREGDILCMAAVAHLNGNAAVAVRDDAVVHDNIFKVAHLSEQNDDSLKK